MDLNTTAEFRIIEEDKIEGLIQAAVVKKKVTKKFFGLSKDVEFIDNFEPYIDENTRSIGILSGKGFIYFSDLVRFLKEFKSIDLGNIILDSKAITQREESSLFINASTVKTLFEKLNNSNIKTEELKSFNMQTDMGDLMSDSISFQVDQIKQFTLILSQVKSDFLYIRSECSFS